MSVNNGKHYTLSDRIITEQGITNGSTKAAIAKTLGKDKSTVGKEIKNHLVKVHSIALPLDCSNYAKCSHGRKCQTSCPDYKAFKCDRRDRSPGACNGCGKYNNCRHDKFKYIASEAQKEYEATLKESREGFNITTSELKQIGSIIEPLIKQGQSLYTILQDHPEIELCEKTLYTYIESGIFKDVGIDLGPMDLRRQVNRKLPKDKKNLYKPRNDYSYLKNHLYSDYLSYMEDNPYAKVVQLDTVYNDVSDGPFLETLKFTKYHFLFSFLCSTRDSSEMNNGILLLESILGEELFNTEVEVLLTDRGSEFQRLKDIEYREDGSRRFHLFYCDPMMSCQKGSLENNHIELRYILPKQYDLTELGLVSQEALNLVLSHVNSFKKENLNGKSPFEVLHFFCKELYDKFLTFGLQDIEPSSIILKPILLKDFRNN